MLATVFFYAVPVLAQVQIIPQCALDNPGPGVDEKECRSISIFITLLINFSKYLFGIVGALALLFFIYGGFTLILSRGTTDSVKKGKDIMVAAIVGLIIVFGAYMLVRFLSSTLGVREEFKLQGS
mgnify:CR=1 FL=1